MTREAGETLGDITTIPLTKSTRDRLRRVGRKGETYDDVLNRLLDVQEQIDGGARVVVPFEEVRE